MLNDISCCAKENKLDSLCGSCKRNINQWDITPQTIFADFVITTTKKRQGNKWVVSSITCNGKII